MQLEEQSGSKGVEVSGKAEAKRAERGAGVKKSAFASEPGHTGRRTWPTATELRPPVHGQAAGARA
jgi:hypothetical protein